MVMIYSEIGKGTGVFFNADTDKLRAFINKYGVDYFDDGRKHLFHYIDGMSREQIDMIMEHKPRLNVEGGNIMYLLGFYDTQSIHVLKRVIEYDTEFYLLKDKMQLRSPFIGKDEIIMVNYAEYLRHIMKKHNILYGNNESVLNILYRMVLLVENHEKRYYKLFDLLKHKIE